jgi:short-subunit dehydrogenase
MTGPTALITGASAGLGAQFAIRLAADRYRLVLVARDHDRLTALASYLRGKHGVGVEVLVADLVTGHGRELVADRLRRAGPDAVDLLVNNAGFGYATPTTSNTIEQELQLFEVDALAKVELTLAVLPRMLAAGAGEIINVSSVAALAPVWTDNCYGAAQACTLSFTEALAYARAVRTSGVRLMALCPGAVKTEFNARAGIPDALTPNWRWITAEAVVNSALRDLRRGRRVSIPTLRYKLLALLLRHLPHRAAPLYMRDYGDLDLTGAEVAAGASS